MSRQSNLKFRPEKTEIISISLTLACSILKSWMGSDSNKFVLIRSEGRVSGGKQLVLRTASTYQLLVKAPSWLHWDWLLKSWRCTATTRCSVIVGIQISKRGDANMLARAVVKGVYWDCRLAVSHIVVYEAGAEPDIFIWGGHWRGQFCNKGSCQWSV